LEDSITLTSPVTDAHSWLQSIDIFISNSYWEGLQNALIEAMATGCYCISHAWGGVEEALPAENICVTDRELEEKIIQYSALPEIEKSARRALMRKKQKRSLMSMLPAPK